MSPHDSPRHPGDDEISLVDLAKVLIHRWKLMAAVFLTVLAAALVYVLAMMTPSHEYRSIYHIAEQAAGDTSGDMGALEGPGTVVAKIDNLYLGEVTRELLAEKKLDGLPFGVTVENPGDTLLIKLSSTATEANAPLVEAMHARLLERVQSAQQALVERRRDSLEQQLAGAERALQAAQQAGSAGAGELVASYASRVTELQDRLAQLRGGEVAQVAVQSLETNGTRPSLVMALALVLGGMLAVMAAFLAQFAAAVRDSLDEESA